MIKIMLMMAVMMMIMVLIMMMPIIIMIVVMMTRTAMAGYTAVGEVPKGNSVCSVLLSFLKPADSGVAKSCTTCPDWLK